VESSGTPVKQLPGRRAVAEITCRATSTGLKGGVIAELLDRLRLAACETHRI